MARHIVTETVVTDDIDGSPATETVAFSVDGTAYEIDLSKSNRKAFDKAVALYVGHARKVRASRTRTSTRRGTGAKPDLAHVRAWAAENGWEVAERGRVASAVLEAYGAAN